MEIQCKILLPLILLFTSCATVDKEITTSSDEEITTSSDEEITTSNGEEINTPSGEWINLYDNQTTFGEILQLRGPPFDVQINEDKITMSLYYYIEDDRDLTTTRQGLRKEEVEFDSNGKFLNVSIQEKERVWGGGTMGSVAGKAAQSAIGSPVLFDPLLPILLTDALTTNSGNPRSEEMNRIKTFLESRSLTFSEKQWKSQRFIYNLWVKNEKDNK